MFANSSFENVVHFAHIHLEKSIPHGHIELTVYKTKKPPLGFGFDDKGIPTTLDLVFIPPAITTHFFTYQTLDISSWDKLNDLFNTLKENNSKIFYTFNSTHREFTSFDDFKNGVIARMEESKAETIWRKLSIQD